MFDVIESPASWPQPPIADYAFLSDCQSAALVDRTGSIDWWCVPRFDSPSVFGRLLDADAGHWTLGPADEFETSREYVEDTLVLRTLVTTATGTATITDALALEPGARGHEIGLRSPHVLLRRVAGITGTVHLRTELAPRMEYGRTQPLLTAGAGGVEARGGPVRLVCTGPVTWACSDGTARATFSVAAGETVELALRYLPSFPATATVPPRDYAARPTAPETIESWQSWTQQHTSYAGAYPDQVRRSSIVLQGLTFAPSGAVIAAATTSLPELLGGELNFDYRYAWLRDLSLTIRSLWIAACPQEPGRLFDWFATAAGHYGDELVQIMYGVEGERDLSEHELPHLAGYRGSRPVRVGNDAWRQKQLDVLGEVLDAAHILRESLGELEPPVQKMLVALADRAAQTWQEPDAGMWEARDAERHYTSSKVMCWVALDRAIDLAPHLGPGADAAAWAAAREKLRAAICDQAWSERSGAYTGAFGSDDLDASILLLPLVGFLPATDERMWRTIETIARELGPGGIVRRWPSDPSGFLICTFWLAECLALGGRPDRADDVFRAATAHANDLGLLSEEVDPRSGVLLGNFPQAFSHVGLVNAAWRIGTAATTTAPDESAPDKSASNEGES